MRLRKYGAKTISITLVVFREREIVKKTTAAIIHKLYRYAASSQLSHERCSARVRTIIEHSIGRCRRNDPKS